MKMKSVPGMALACGLILANALIQIIGYFNSGMPDFFWCLSNAIMIMTPLLFGIKIGLLCMIPMAVSELVWFGKLLVPGPLLHLAAFIIVILPFGMIAGRLSDLPRARRAWITGILYEAGILGEELLYSVFRCLCLPDHPPVTWAAVSVTFMSPANLVVLCTGLAYIAFISGQKNGKP